MSYGNVIDLLINISKFGGCLAKVAVPDSKKVKISPKIINCIFIGYASNSSAYRFLVHK